VWNMHEAEGHYRRTGRVGHQQTQSQIRRTQK
jgi:hypothetical protein